MLRGSQFFSYGQTHGLLCVRRAYIWVGSEYSQSAELSNSVEGGDKQYGEGGNHGLCYITTSRLASDAPLLSTIVSGYDARRDLTLLR